MAHKHFYQKTFNRNLLFYNEYNVIKYVQVK